MVCIVMILGCSSKPVVTESYIQASEIVLSKEVLVAGKQVVSNGGIGLSKTVKTEKATVPVELKTESYEIVRVAPNGQTPDFSPAFLYVEVTREQPVAIVQAQVVEVVRVNKKVSTEASTVSGNVRTETLVTTPR